MRFLTKINRNYLVPMLTVLFILSGAGYFVLRVISNYGARERLLSTEYLVGRQIRERGTVPSLYPLIEVRQTENEPEIVPSFKKVTIRNEIEGENEEFLEYTSKVNISGSWYLLKIRQSTIENEDLVLILAFTLLLLLAAALTISYFSTHRLNRTVWSGFEKNLHAIEEYSLRINQEISLQKTGIEEFEKLNAIIAGFTEKIRSDYTMLKEFTENASHEIQTPLSVALLNLEEILQEDINEEVFKKVVIAINSLKRLTALNQNLILLTRIENRQFETVAEININRMIHSKKEELSLLIEAKGLEFIVHEQGDFNVRMNEFLAEILIGNLLSNAVTHNIPKGSINILIRQDFLRICNTGESHSLTNDNIFNRFVSSRPKSSGIGLAIVRQICDTHHLDVEYTKGDLHCFILKPKR